MNRALTVAWLGLGSMGRPMARNLVRATRIVDKCYVWNRTAAVSHKHATEHGTVAVEDLVDIGAKRADIIFTCMPTSNEVEATMKTLGPHLAPDTIVVDTTSGDPLRTKEIAEHLQQFHVHLIDAPVSGGPAGAAAGQLSVLVGGEREHVNRARRVLDVNAKAITHLGPVGAGHAVKAINNVFNATQILMASEGIAALLKLGICPRKALAAINESSGRSTATEARLPEHVLTRKFAYNFKLGLMLKDVKTAVGITKSVVPSASILPLTEELTRKSVELLGFDADYTELARLIEHQAGIEIRPLGDSEDEEPQVTRIKQAEASGMSAVRDDDMNDDLPYEADSRAEQEPPAAEEEQPRKE